MGKMNFDKINAYLARIPKEIQGKEVQVGYFEGIQYEDGTEVAYVATIHEFGAPSQKILPRPTMGPTMIANHDRYVKQLGSAAAAVQRGAISGDDALDAIGTDVATDIQVAISDLRDPPIKEATSKRKGFDKPLEDTFLMHDSVQSAVTKK